MTLPPLGTVLANPGAHALATTFEDGDDRRRPVLEAAARLLAEEGPHGLSLRRIAAEAGGSTQLVYTLFGGKPGLADALYEEGFARLRAACTAALASAPPLGDPERIMAIGRSYREFALAEPAFFAVMFGRAIPDFTPTRTTTGRCRQGTFGRLVSEVQACLDAGTLIGSDAESLAKTCWVTVHGLAALQSAGMLRADDPEAFVDEVLRTPLLAHHP